MGSSRLSIDRISEYFAPSEWFPAPVDRRRIRIILAIAPTAAFWGPFYLVVFDAFGLPASAAATYVAGPLIVSSPFVLRFTRSLRLTAHIPSVALAGVVTVNVWETGGTSSPALSWFLTLPVAAFAFGGPRHGSIWTVIAIGIASGLGGLEAWAIAPPTFTVSPGLSVSATFGLIGVIVSYALAFELHSNRMVADLNATNLELATARDEALASVEAKARFLANMSHEIRTPMNGVIGMVEVLSRTPLSDEQQNYVGRVKACAQSLLRVIGDVLDYSKIEAGKLEICEAPFDLTAVIEDSAGLLEPVAREAGLALDVEIDPRLPRWLVGDPVRISQVLINLLGNAIKFTKQGGVQLRASSSGRDEDRVRLRVEIEDSGVGIAADKLETIFDQFTQVDESATRRYGGTGLGLAIGRELVDRMGGALGVRSQLGEGSCFWFDLTLAVTEPPAPEMESACEPIDARLLLVEDNHLNRLIAIAALEQIGCGVDVACNGREAVVAAGGPAFDAILMDCQMPVLDGYAATRQIRRGGGPNARTPIIAFTANATQADRERCVAAGMDEYIAKPLCVEEVTAALKRQLSKPR